jgi:pimeloyl-ACP methyl ester carboxylesterase
MKISGSELFTIIAISGSFGFALWTALLRLFPTPKSNPPKNGWWLDDKNLIKWARNRGDLFWGSISKHHTYNHTGSTGTDLIRHAEIIVILIHGTTFGLDTKHKWMENDSNFCRALRGIGPPDKTAVIRFHWSGRNRFTHRHQAAASLRQQIAATRRVNEHAKLFLIAHSHGGSIASQALQDSETCSEVDGFVSLSTPYLHAGPIREKVSKDTMILARIGGIFFIPFFTISLFTAWNSSGPIMPALNNKFKCISEANIGWIALWMAPIFVAGILLWTIYTRIKEHAAALIQQSCHQPKISRDRLLILRTQGDEASSLIGAIGFTNWLSGKFFNLAMRPVDIIGQTYSQFTNSNSNIFAALKIITAITLLIAALTASSLLALGYIESNPTKWIDISAIQLVFLIELSYFVLAIAALGLLLGLALALIITRKILSGISVGWELMLAGSNIVVSAEAAPPGMWEITHLEVVGNTNEAIPLRGALLHSVLYDSSKAISLITHWMKSKI